MKYLSLLLSFLILSCFYAEAQPGSFDSGFATNGVFTSQIDSTADEAKCLAILEDGSIITAGYFGISSFENPTGEDFYLRKFNTDGSPDMSFGENGITIIDVQNGTDAAWDVEIQSDGKILVAGLGYQSWERGIVMRFNPDGSLDNSFSGDGIAVIEIGGFSDRLWDMEIQEDGKIVACGTCFVSGSTNDWCAARLFSNGNLDPSFGDGGTLSLDLGNVQVSANDLAILEDGRILMAGYGNPSGTYLMQFAMLNSDGSLDESWDEDGLVEVSIDNVDDAIEAIAIQEDGKIVASGYSFNGSNYDFALIRLNSDGSLDESFGESGIIQTPIGTSDEFINSLFIRSDGRIVVGGYSRMDDTWFDFALAMYNSDGTLVESFGNSGIVTTALSPDEDVIFQIKEDAAGNILAVGTTESETSGEEVYEMAIVKYLGDLSLGVIDTGTSPQLMVYPNPIASSARLQFELSNGGRYSVELYDLSGRFIEQISPEMSYLAGGNEILLDFPRKLNSGAYLLRLQSDKETVEVRIIKE